MVQFSSIYTVPCRFCVYVECQQTSICVRMWKSVWFNIIMRTVRIVSIECMCVCVYAPWMLFGCTYVCICWWVRMIVPDRRTIALDIFNMWYNKTLAYWNFKKATARERYEINSKRKLKFHFSFDDHHGAYEFNSFVCTRIPYTWNGKYSLGSSSYWIELTVLWPITHSQIKENDIVAFVVPKYVGKLIWMLQWKTSHKIDAKQKKITCIDHCHGDLKFDGLTANHNMNWQPLENAMNDGLMYFCHCCQCNANESISDLHWKQKKFDFLIKQLL